MIILFLFGYRRIFLGDLELVRVSPKVWSELSYKLNQLWSEGKATRSEFQGGFGYQLGGRG